MPDATSDPLLDRQILRVVVGSQAHGLAGPNSDEDVRGVFLPTAERHWSLDGVPESLRSELIDLQIWELRRFLTLALKSNPTVLETLFTPLVIAATPLGEELRALGPKFLSKRLHAACNGFAERRIVHWRKARENGRPNWKMAMHGLRVLATGANALAGDGFPVHVGPHRKLLRSVRRGERSVEEVEELAAEWRSGLDLALRHSPLPAEPDAAAADAFLIHARRLAARSRDLP